MLCGTGTAFAEAEGFFDIVNGRAVQRRGKCDTLNTRRKARKKEQNEKCRKKALRLFFSGLF